MSGRKQLLVALPKGSLCGRLLDHLREAGYKVREPESNGYCGETDRLRFELIDRQLLPRLVHNGSFDAGITGQDIHWDSGCKLAELAHFNFARHSDRPSRWVLATKKGFSPSRIKPEQNGVVRIGCELPRFGKELLKDPEKVRPLPFEWEIVRIPGSEEAAVAYGYVDIACVVTETGNSLRDYNLKVMAGYNELFISHPALYTLHHPTGERLEVLERLADDLRTAISQAKTRDRAVV